MDTQVKQPWRNFSGTDWKGARVPVVLTSRADSVRARLASAGVAVRLAHDRRKGGGK